MSINIAPLKVLKNIDPRLRVDRERYFTADQGALNNTFRQVNASSYTSSNSQFTIIPPSVNTIIDRKLYFRAPRLRVTFTGTGNPLLNMGVVDALRAYPINSIITSMEVRLNTASVSLTPQDVFPALLRYYTSDQESDNYGMSMSPAMQDQFSTYEQGIGSSRNPMQNYANNSAYDSSRGSFPILAITNGNGTATIDFEITEPLLLSPFLFGNMDEQSGLVNLTNLDVNMNFGNIARIWSHSLYQDAARTTPSNVISDVQITFVEPPQLLCNFLSVNPLDVVIPELAVYPWFDINRFITNAQALLPQVSSTVTSNSIKLNSVPDRMYIYVRPRNSDIYANVSNTISIADTFAAISAIRIDFQNQASLLANATQEDLYRMSRRNGMNLSWAQFSGQALLGDAAGSSAALQYGVGSPICVSFANDISNSVIAAPGSLGEFQLQVSVDYKDIRPNAAPYNAISRNYDLYLVIVNVGTITLGRGNATTQIGVLTQNDVLNARNMPEMLTDIPHSYYGGKFNFAESLGKAANFLKAAYQKAVPVYKQLKDTGVLTKGADIAEALTPLIPEVGVPLQTGVKLGRKVLGVGARRKSGRGVIGAGLMTRADLRNTIEDYEGDY